MPAAPHVLSIVIPALDEEDAIGETIRRCLAARAHIIANSPVSEVEIIVVSDGSTDRTEEIAKGFEEVTVLGFAANRGYGAAIKSGWEIARGDWLAFLDGDGTCDPIFFADLCTALDAQGADLVLGSRMGEDSEMPRLRALGNSLFSLLLGVLSKQGVRDTASGMRVVRRRCLAELYPLPDGLHFTPSMSGRVLLGGKLKLVELPMRYSERTGESKLRVLRDGFRFLMVILRAAVTFRPARLLLFVAGVVGGTALLVGSGPWFHWLRETRLAEWEIYRILLASLLATLSAMLVCSALVAERIAAAAHGRPPADAGVTGACARLFTSRSRRVGGSALLLLALVLVWPGVFDYVTTGSVQMHWSRAMLASLLVVIAGLVAVTTFLLNMLTLIEYEGTEPLPQPPPTRVRSGRAPVADT